MKNIKNISCFQQDLCLILSSWVHIFQQKSTRNINGKSMLDFPSSTWTHQCLIKSKTHPLTTCRPFFLTLQTWSALVSRLAKSHLIKSIAVIYSSFYLLWRDIFVFLILLFFIKDPKEGNNKSTMIQKCCSLYFKLKRGNLESFIIDLWRS